MTRKAWYIVIPLACYIVGTYLVMFVLDKATIDFITMEDHYFENLGALSLFVASVFFAWSFFATRKRADEPKLRKLAYLGLAALFFFGAGEEISWGQRILHLQTPEAITEVNAKNEINIHNLDIFHTGGKNTLPFKVFQVFGFTLLLFIPLAATLYPRSRKWFERFIPVLPWGFGILFLANFGAAKIASLLTYLGQPGEIQESNYELLFAVVGVYVLFAMVKAAKPAQETVFQPVTPPAKILS